MGIKDSFKKMMFIDEEEFTEEEIRAEERKQEQERKEKKMSRETKATDQPDFLAQSKPPARKKERNQPLEKRISMTNQNSLKLVLVEPESFEDSKRLVDSLKGRRPVIINLENIETSVAQKIFDFLSGATCALDGSVKKISNNIFIFAPENVNVYDENKAQDGKTFEFTTEGSPWR